MQLVCVPIVGAWIIFYNSQHVYHLYIALCLSGFTGKDGKSAEYDNKRDFRVQIFMTQKSIKLQSSFHSETRSLNGK